MTGKEEQRARDLFYALWIPDLFMKRVEANEDWTLMCPHECPGLADVYGDEFVKLYEKWVTNNGCLFCTGDSRPIRGQCIGLITWNNWLT